MAAAVAPADGRRRAGEPRSRERRSRERRSRERPAAARRTAVLWVLDSLWDHLRDAAEHDDDDDDDGGCPAARLAAHLRARPIEEARPALVFIIFTFMQLSVCGRRCWSGLATDWASSSSRGSGSSSSCSSAGSGTEARSYFVNTSVCYFLSGDLLLFGKYVDGGWRFAFLVVVFCSLSFPVVLFSLPVAGCAVSAGVPTAV